ncbi:MAG: hypothetical protein ABIR58_06620 [Gemmatimonadaceae bacterium]
MTIDVLDCTLRDGGYQNAWDFPDELVGKYLRALEATGCRYVEMGYRACATDSLAGRYRYSPDHLLKSHCSGLGLTVAVMIDGKALCDAKGSVDPIRLETMFCARDQSPVHLVRIAATVEIVKPASAMCGWLRERGYEVSINLMQASTLEVSSIRRAARHLNESGANLVYLADSFGGLTPGATMTRTGALASSFHGRVGFHAHDNMGLAFANTIAAIGAGATIVDSSVLGMGRGAGNLRTEQLLQYLETTGRSRVTAAPLFDLVATEFAQLHAQHGWGPRLPYLMTGAYNIHPTYAQTLLRDPGTGASEVVGTLQVLSADPERSTFSAATLGAAMTSAGAAVRRRRIG